MKFVDRKRELGRLLRLSSAGAGGFAVVWGRRRIGKSELLKEWCRRVAGGLYTVADRSAAVVQRQNFAQALAERLPGFDDAVYPTWKALFDSLARQARSAGWRGPLVLDEIPYWVESDASVVSALQNWVDEEKRTRGLLVAVAGSSQRMMQGLVLNADSPIYGRADEKIKLPPIGLGYVQEALGLSSATEAVKAYAVWGGVPRYWVEAERYGRRLDEAVDEQVLDPLGVFHDEPLTILQSEIPSALSLKPYLDVVGFGANRLSEIAARLGVPATTVSKPLMRLVELGLVKREVPYGEDEKNSKKSLYRIADPFCRLWFRVLASRRSLFESASSKIRRQVWRTQAGGLFAAEWEECARSSVIALRCLAKRAGKGDFWLPAGRWWRGNEPELDVVSFNGQKSRVLIGEAKWSEKAFSAADVKRLAKALLERPVPSHFPADVVRVLFLSSVERGVPVQVEGVTVVDADAVCRAGMEE